MSDANGVEKHEDGMIGRGEISENETNQTKFDENVSTTQEHDFVEVTANSGVDSGLDKGVAQPGEAGEREQGEVRTSNSEIARPIPKIGDGSRGGFSSRSPGSMPAGVSLSGHPAQARVPLRDCDFFSVGIDFV